MTTLRHRLRHTKVAVPCILAIALLLVAAAGEANAQQHGCGQSSSFNWRSGGSWGIGPGGFEFNRYRDSSWNHNSYGFSPWGGFNSSRGGSNSRNWGGGYGSGTGLWGYQNASGSGYNSFNRWRN